MLIRLAGALGVLAMLLPTASGAIIETSPPAQWTGETSQVTTDTTIVLFGPDGGTMELEASAGSSVYNYTQRSTIIGHSGTGYTSVPEEPLTSERTAATKIVVRLDFPSGSLGGVVLRGPALIAGDAWSADLGAIDEGKCIEDLLTQEERRHGVLRPGTVCTGRRTAALATWHAAEHTLESNDITSIEWHGADATCISGPCPVGAQRYWTGIDQGGLTASTLHHPFEGLRGDIVVHLNGSARLIAADNLEIHTTSAVFRLPEASSAECGSECAGSTLQIQADDAQASLAAPEGTATITMDVTGDLSGVWADERPVDPTLLAAGAAAATIGFAGLLGAAFWAARVFQEDALEHPTRKTLYDHILEKPGRSMRELGRELDVPLSTIRHHLSILKRHRMIAEFKHRNSSRFFENHGAYDKKWKKVMAARQDWYEPTMQYLEERDGEAPKPRLVKHLVDEQGWSRSVTYKRLTQMENAGVLSYSEDGYIRLLKAT